MDMQKFGVLVTTKQEWDYITQEIGIEWTNDHYGRISTSVIICIELDKPHSAIVFFQLSPIAFFETANGYYREYPFTTFRQWCGLTKQPFPYTWTAEPGDLVEPTIHTPMPDYLVEAMNERNCTDMSVVCDWANGMYQTEDGYTIEVYHMISHAGTPAVRMLATINGDTLIGKHGIAHTKERVLAFYDNAIPVLERLDNASSALTINIKV